MGRTRIQLACPCLQRQLWQMQAKPELGRYFRQRLLRGPMTDPGMGLIRHNQRGRIRPVPGSATGLRLRETCHEKRYTIYCSKTGVRL